MVDYNSVCFFEEQPVPLPTSDCELIIVAWRLKTPENLGSIMRLAGNLGVRRVVAVESHIGNINFDRLKRLARTAFAYSGLETVKEAEVLDYLPADFSKVALETAPGSQNIYTVKLPSKMALFVGNEQAGLPNYLVDACDMCLHIPLPGQVKSMNVAQATTVAAFEWYRQQVIVKD
jgi:tRNA G18 (ribose-2'-O)-methylase SpoU